MQLAPTFLLTRHVLLQCGFTQCGTVEYPSYSPKTAFDKSF